MPCDDSCATCKGSGSGNCLTCPYPFVMTATEGICQSFY